MTEIDRGVFDFLDEHIADHVAAGVDMETIGDDASEPARKVVGQLTVLECVDERT